MSKKLVFFGTEKFSVYALEALIASGWNVVAVVTKPDYHSGRGLRVQEPVVKQIAKKHSIDILQPEHLIEYINTLKKYACSIAVLSAYGKLIPNGIINTFKTGIINIHPSLLPSYRGASPIEQVILNGDSETGVSLMKLVKEMDAGPIYAQQKVRLTGHETAPELYETLGQFGGDLLMNKLSDIVAGKVSPAKQESGQATYTSMINKSDGKINWNQDATVIERQIRAYLGWPGSKTTLANLPVTITKARVEKLTGKPGVIFSGNKKLGVYCGKNSILIELLKPAGKREMTSQEFLAGHATHI